MRIVTTEAAEMTGAASLATEFSETEDELQFHLAAPSSFPDRKDLEGYSSYSGLSENCNQIAHFVLEIRLIADCLRDYGAYPAAKASPEP